MISKLVNLEAIHLVVVIEGGNKGRRVTDLVRVNGLDTDGRFVLHHLNASGEWI